MKPFPLPANEDERINELKGLEVIEHTVEEAYNDIINIVVNTFHPGIAAITLLDQENQWFKSIYGSDLQAMPRHEAVCNYTILQDDILEFTDMGHDERFTHIPFVKEDPHYEYYAGIAIVSSKGFRLGSLCFMDTKSHHLTPHHRQLLKVLSHHLTFLLESKSKEKMLQEYIDTHNRMIAITGHEMRNPLENFKFMLNMQHSLKEGLNEEEAVKMNELLKKQLNGMFELLNNLTQWGQLQIGEVAKKTFGINLHDRVNSLLDNLKAEATIKGNKLFNNISPATIIRFDANAFDFVMRNLLTNANKFTENGTIEVSSEITADYHQCIIVKDSGIGMNETEVEQLLKYTGKLSKLGTRNEKGSGLGFALVREFLNRHQSSLQIQSKPKQGTTISFSL